MTDRKWTVAPTDAQCVARLISAGYPGLLAGVLCARGVDTPEKAQALLEPESRPLRCPMELRDMDRAVVRIRRALDAGEQMAIFGDYDVDGITATSLLTDFLQKRGGSVIPYIPDRMEEGYGLNPDAVRELAARGVKLIITVDCGITAVAEVALARSLGVDVVVTDHHACKSDLPDACAVVDPHRPDCPYPFKGLAGVGVALKLAMAIAGEAEYPCVFSQYADLAAIGTIADVMPMTDENRIIVRKGLKILNRAPRLGIALLMQEAGLEGKPLNTTAIGYTLAPRINASGRMGKAALAAELMLTQDREQGVRLAQALCTLNRERQDIESQIFQECAERLEHEPQEGLILLAGEGWHQGVIGIVASRLSERYACPTFMVCLSDGMGKGSCRSWGGINLFALLARCQDLLEEFGGHALAAGFTVREDRIPQLRTRLHQELPNIAQDEGDTCLLLDCAVQAEDLTVEAIAALDRLEPCGVGNPRPALLLPGAQIISLNQVGRGRHLKLRLESRGKQLDAIWFSGGEEAARLAPGHRVDVAFYPQINEFRGARTPQLQVIALTRAPTRAEAERAAFEKYSRGEALTAQEAKTLLPERDEFVRVWRYLKVRSNHCPVIEDTLLCIARGTAAGKSRKETVPRTVICLEVLEERGLIRLSRQPNQISISINAVDGKVDLEESCILRRLRKFAGH